jgi:coproporphyrinogen III oxidase
MSKKLGDVLKIREQMMECVSRTQQNISEEMSLLNERSFLIFPWKVEEKNSSGCAHYFSEGKFIEKGCANISTTMKAPVFEKMAKLFLPPEQLSRYSKYSYFVTSLSTIFHPISPLIPTIHANYRYFEIFDEGAQPIFWFFGGGTDLAPSYVFEEDFSFFHSSLKATCDKTDPTLYSKLKKDADAYFYLPHRKEHRGIGGTFSLMISDRPKEALYEWVKNSCDTLLAGYLPFARQKLGQPFTEGQKKWQMLRRGRYAEFILLCDQGFRFGYESGLNVEKSFMAMPPLASWNDSFEPDLNSPEAAMMEILKKPREWA